MATLFELPSNFPKQIIDVMKMVLELEPFKIIMRHIEIILYVSLVPVFLTVAIKIWKILKNRNKT